MKRISFVDSELPILLVSTCYALKDMKVLSYVDKNSMPKKYVSPFLLLHLSCKLKNETDSEFEDSISIKMTEYMKNASTVELDEFTNHFIIEGFTSFPFLSCLIMHRVT